MKLRLIPAILERHEHASVSRGIFVLFAQTLAPRHSSNSTLTLKNLFLSPVRGPLKPFAHAGILTDWG
jgi:hypothetical protein